MTYLHKMNREVGSRRYTVHSSWGPWIVELTDGGVRRIQLPASPPPRGTAFEWEPPSGTSGEDRRSLGRLMNALCCSITGIRKVAAPAMDPGEASAFRRLVWGEMRRIPRGRVKNYGEIAAAIGSERACRAVGGACAANPLPVLIPCHRVVGKRSRGGYSSGAAWKEFLLAIEEGK